MRYANSFSCLEAGVVVRILPLEADFGAAVGVLFLGLRADLDANGIVNIFFSCFLDIFLWSSTFLNLARIINNLVVKFSRLVIYILSRKLV